MIHFWVIFWQNMHNLYILKRAGPHYRLTKFDSFFLYNITPLHMLSNLKSFWLTCFFLSDFLNLVAINLCNSCKVLTDLHAQTWLKIIGVVLIVILRKCSAKSTQFPQARDFDLWEKKVNLWKIYNIMKFYSLNNLFFFT